MRLFGPPDVAKMKAKRDVKGLIKALGYEKDAAIRKSAAEAFGEFHDASAVEPLIDVLGDNDKNVCAQAIESLSRIGVTSIGFNGKPDVEFLKARGQVKVLCKALSYDGWWKIRRDAAEALAEICDPRSIGSLIGALADYEGQIEHMGSNGKEYGLPGKIYIDSIYGFV